MKINTHSIRVGFIGTTAFLAAVGLGLFFRTYSLHHQAGPHSDRSLAALFVEKNIIDHFQKALETQTPNLNDDDRLKLAREQARRAIENDRDQYEQSVDAALKNFGDTLPKKSGRRYLLEADPYYYFYLTEQILQKGKLADRIGGGKYYHPLMRAPDGYWTSVTWHPYAGALIVKIIRLFNSEMSPMEALGWVPIVLSVLVGICFWIFSRVLGLSHFPFLAGGIALMLSPIFIQRSSLGWYDTDPYNYIFPFLILSTVFDALRHPRRLVRMACLGGALTGLYSLFWTGWPFILVLIPAALLAAWAAARWGLGVYPPALSPVIHYLGWYSFAAVISAVIFLSPAGLWNSVQSGWEVLRKFSLSDADVWPNIFLTVGEARSISVKKLIFLSGNYVTFGVAVVGLAAMAWRIWRERNPTEVIPTLFLAALTLPLFVLPLKTERFGILFVIPLSIWVMLGARELRFWIAEGLARGVFFKKHLAFSRVFAGTLFLLLFLPLPVITAHLVSAGTRPIMDDAWYDTMMELRQKTPDNAIVNSWWPPGYFVVGLANRRVVADGGTQHFKETYWLAKVLASQNEREAAGILKMLNQNGNRALEYLLALKIDAADAVDMIMSVMGLTRAEAEGKLPAEMPADIKKQFLDLTHGGSAVPSYVMVYSDMIAQNLAVTVISRWDFRKAREWNLKRARGGRSNGYVQDFLNMTDGILKYSPAVDLQKQEGDVLVFPNGVLVNLALMDAVIQIPEKNIQGRPASLFYVREGKLEEKVFEGERLDVSVLLMHENGVYSVVVADADLIRSLMFRLYYLKGQGLKLFQPFSWKRNEFTGDQVGVFELKPDFQSE